MAKVSGASNADWSWDEHVLALELYMRDPASPPGKRSAEVAELSSLLNEMGRLAGVAMGNKFRNANGVYMKMMNFRRLDPAFQAQGKAGLSQGSRGEAEVWDHFVGDPDALRATALEIRGKVISELPSHLGTPGSLEPANFAAAWTRFQELIALNDNGRPFTGFREGIAAAWEDYKPRLRDHALQLLQAEAWQAEWIGSGQILERVIAAIEIQDPRINLTNNLVFWQNRYGHANRDHRSLLESTVSPSLQRTAERLLYDLFRTEADVFDELAEFTGRKYPLVAYLHFLKDSDRYMPIQPSTLDQAFRELGIDLVTLRNCSGLNYLAYNQALQNVRAEIAVLPSMANVRLVDAHSFCWLLEKLPADQSVIRVSAKSASGRRVGGREGSIIRMCLSIENTARNSNGQIVERTLKDKELRMSRHELEQLLTELMDLQENRCALTGIPFHYHGSDADSALLPSPDRIDSDGHYERGNLQVVCQFINAWKSNTQDQEFRRLLSIVRDGNGGAKTGDIE